MLAARSLVHASPATPSAWLAAWLAAEQGRFAPWLAVAMGAGVLGYFALPAEPPWWPGLSLLPLLAAVTMLCRRAALPRAAALCGLAAALGFVAGQAATWRARPVEPLPSRAVIATGRVEAVEQLPDGRRVTLSAVEPGPGTSALARTVRVRLRPDDPAAPQPGDTLRIHLLLRPPLPPAYPGAWDLQRDSFFDGAGGSGQALGRAEVVDHVPFAGLPAWWRGVRDAVAARVMADIPGPPGAIAATFLTGLTAAIPPDARAAFRDAGLAHLLAVAGLHLGLVMGLVMGAVRLLLALWERAALGWPTKAIAGVSSLAAGLGYTLLVGGHVPVLRSFAMASLVVLAVVTGRRALSLRGLALAAAVLLLAAPNELNGVSFQMSFAAVAALIAGYEALRPALAWLRGENGPGRRVLAHVASLALTSLLAGTASAPYAAFHFGHVQLYAVLANLLAVPITAAVIMPCGLLALLLMPLGLDWLPAVPMGWGTSAVLAIGRVTSALPAATLVPPHIPGWGLAVFSLGLAWLCLWRSRPRLLGLAPMAAGLLAAWLAPAPDVLVSPDARLIALNGDEAFLQSRSGAPGFVGDAWLNYLARDRWMLLPDPALPCDADACRFTARSGATVLLLLTSGARPDCSGVALLVSAEPSRGACPPGVPAVDRFTVWRDGAVAAWVQSRKHYPDDARRQDIEGSVLLRFTVTRDGQVADAKIIRPSGSDLLDQAALSLVQNGRMPPFPPDMTQAQITISVPIRYKLDD